MDKIKTVKIKELDGSISEETYTISVDAKNVDMDNGKDLQYTIGTIDVDTDGNISEQLNYLNENVDNLNIDIKKKAYFFNTVADMKAANLKNGDYACTLGYYEINDGGKADYVIVNSPALVDDGGSVHSLKNGLKAKLIPSNFISIYQFGAKANSSIDDTNAIQNAINYSKNNGYIKIQGSLSRRSYISKTLFVHAYNQIENLSLETLANASFTRGFMISVNSSDVSTWDIQYPNSEKGYFKHIALSNSIMTPNINGIYNAGNNKYWDIVTFRLNKSFENSHTYLDVVQINNMQIGYRMGNGDDWAINLGYLGDACKIDTAHMYGGSGTPNFITGFGGHNAITLKNIICNGNMRIEGGNVSIENIHSESGQITIINSIVNISNGFFYHNDPNIIINNSYVKLNQLEFAYYSIRQDYTNSNDIDINITNSDVEINECYKTVKADDIAEKITSFVKTNLDTQPTVNTNKKYYRGETKYNYEKCNIKNKTKSAAYAQLSEKVKWRLPSGTYYYKCFPIVDVSRKLRTALYDGTGNATLTNGDRGFRFASVTNGMWRVYRGTADNAYTHYVDIAINGGSIQDDGILCNGYKWIERTSGGIDSFKGLSNDTPVIYNNDNIICVANGLPSIGDWIKGDIIYKPTVGENDSIGWICIASGTPGTWKEL